MIFLMIVIVGFAVLVTGGLVALVIYLANLR